MKTLARTLRQNQTPSEKLLWRCLRNQHIQGYRFRRQQPNGPYSADFCCLQVRLVIEIDGEIHSEPIVVARDTVRQRYLENEGFQVLRFSSKEVMENLEGVVSAIEMVLAASTL